MDDNYNNNEPDIEDSDVEDDIACDNATNFLNKVPVAVDQDATTTTTNATTTKKARVTPATANKVVSQRGIAYSVIEDYMISVAFITASEDAIAGVSQKSHTFKEKMYKTRELLIEQVRMEILRMNNVPGTISPLHKGYDKQSSKTIHDRFKAHISLRCTKMMGVEKSNPMRSGHDIKSHEKMINFTFNQRHKNLGPAEDVRVYYNYLKDRPKWNAYHMAQDEVEKNKLVLMGIKKRSKIKLKSHSLQQYLKNYGKKKKRKQKNNQH
jgi:hypothetical protein